MQKFFIEVNAPVEIKLMDNEYFEQSAKISIVPNKNARGFKIFISEMTDRVALITDETDEFKNDFVFDKDDFEARMEKLRSK